MSSPRPPAEQGFFQSKWKSLSNHPRWNVFTHTNVMAALLLLCGSLYGFAQIADEVLENETYHFDSTILLWFRTPGHLEKAIGPSWLTHVALDVTSLGGTTVLIFVLAVTLGFLWIGKKRKAFLLIAAAGIGGQIFATVLKLMFARARPEIVPHLIEVHTKSFPSGHSMMSAVVYLTLGALLSRLVDGKLLRWYILGVSIFLTIMIGLSRVFLGVHFPTDVLAGWTAGLAWSLVCLLVARILQHAGKVEQPGEHTDNPLAKN